MKKLMCLLLVIFLITFLVGCSEKTANTDEEMLEITTKELELEILTGGNEQVSEVKSSIDLPTTEEIVTTLCSDEFEGRQTFSEGNQKAGKYIADIFDKIGLVPLSKDSYFQPYTKEDVVNREDYDTSETAHNIVGYIKGKDSKKAIIISAHFDGRGIREGEIYRSAMDNASGVAALIKIAEELKQVSIENPFESNIIFCAFNGEEQLYVGSTAFVNQAKSESWYENIYNINIDSIGAKDGGAFMFPNDSEYSAKLYESIKNSIKNNDIDLVEFERPIASDHRSFEKAGKANICIVQEGWLEWIHKPIDTPDILDYIEIEKIAKALSDFIKNNDGTVY